MFEPMFGSAGSRWPVVRLRAGSQTEVMLLGDRFFALTTHWVGHTVPCSVDDCGLCEVVAARGLFYLAVANCGRTSLLELGALSANDLEQHCKLLHGGMRPGLIVEVSRRGAKSPVRSEGVRFQDGVAAISILDLAAHALALYKFPPPNPGESMGSYEVRCRTIAQRRNQLTATQLKGRVGGPV